MNKEIVSRQRSASMIQLILEKLRIRKPLIKPSAFLERSGTFKFIIPVYSSLMCGDYVHLSSDSGVFLGQVCRSSFDFLQERKKPDISLGSFKIGLGRFTESSIVSAGFYEGSGEILAKIEDSKAVVEFDRGICTGDVSMGPASSDEVKSYFKAVYSNKSPHFPIGTLLNIEGAIRAELIADGFKRHSGLFGQSGSGKSFALGILLEELHLKTNVNIVVLDFNGDFIRFKESIRGINEINHRNNRYLLDWDEFRKYGELHDEKRNYVKIVSANQGENIEPIVIRFSDLEKEEQSLLLEINHIQSWQLYNTLSSILDELNERDKSYDIKDVLRKAEREKEKNRRLISRIRNSGLEKLRIWGNLEDDERPLVDLIDQGDLQTIIIDLSSLTRVERFIVSIIVLRKIWNKQIERKKENVEKPCFLLVDEVHHLFPAKPLSPEQELTLEWGTRIAGEGRKFGFYLLICSQLPSKIHEHILTQCGNLILMKMLSQSDINALQDTFSFVPETLMQMSKSFQIGDALVTGSIVPSILLIHFEGRKTREGGSDFRVNWNI